MSVIAVPDWGLRLLCARSPKEKHHLHLGRIILLF